MAKIREYEIISGPYSGTYGSVSIGRHTTLEVTRAIKQLHDHVRSEVIKQEALKQRDVRSPYVAQIYDFFENENAILMEFCPTGLDEYLRNALKRTPAGLPFDEARDLLHGILQGLNDAHAAGVVHGDIKPANVRFGAGKTEGELGLPKLSDFGAARRLREDIPGIRGSTNWMAPELIGGEQAIKECDYFSFGILAYLALTGRHPYFADDPTCLTSEEDNIKDPMFRPTSLVSLRSDIPVRVGELIMDLLSRDPAVRARAEQDLKAALSTPPEPTEEKPAVSAAPALHPTEEETLRIRAAYEQARRAFFVDFRPYEAVSVVDDFLADLGWERFKGTRVAGIADCWSLRAFINNSGGRFDEAVAAATQGLDVDPDHVNSLHACGYAYIQLGEYDQAKVDLERALLLTPDPVKRRQISRLLDTLRARQPDATG
jgi:tetratricopeptide (TPR) repeat protein